MSLSSRFTIGVHVLTVLALTGEEPATSEYIASSVNTNPVVIRRALGRLRDAGLVEVQMGTGGGWRLRRPAAEITLLQVYRAVEEGAIFALHPQPPNPECPVGGNIQGVLTGVFGTVEAAMQGELARTTVADTLRGVLVRARARAAAG